MPRKFWAVSARICVRPGGRDRVVAGDHVGPAAALEEDDRLDEVGVEAASLDRVVDERAERLGPPRGREHAAGALPVERMGEAEGGRALEVAVLRVVVGERVGLRGDGARDERARGVLSVDDLERDPHRRGHDPDHGRDGDDPSPAHAGAIVGVVGHGRGSIVAKAPVGSCDNAGMSALPSGTVTFVFSDIEGSTGLLKRLGDRYAKLIAEHRRIVRESFGAHDGVEIDTQGDSFFFAFARARDAAAAAVDAQRGHAEAEWPGGEEVRVRMGLHTGEPAVGAEGYLGVDVVRAARLAATGRGGSVLLSETTRALIGSALPDGVSVHALGERQLKDIDEPERIYELAIEGVEQPEVSLTAPEPSEVDVEVDWEKHAKDFEKRLSDKINESVFRSLERSFGVRKPDK